MSRALDVVSRKHEHTCFSLSFVAQRHMNRHLVTVEVSVERGTNKRMQADCLTFNEHGLECLDAQTVKGWSAVQEHGMFRDDLFKHVPNVACATIHCALRCLDVGCIFKLDQTLDDEGLEELECHRRRQTALMQFQGRTNNDYRTARVVNALTEQILTETTLLALEHIGDRLQRTIARARYRTTAATVVEERVDRFLQHALFVVHDDLRSTEIEQTLQAVVTVDHTTIEVVQVGRCETATIELHHRAQIGRNNRDNIEDHIGRLILRMQECIDDLQTLDGLGALLAFARSDHFAQLFSGCFKIDRVEQVAYRFSTHATTEVLGVVRAHFAIELLIGNELLGFDLQEGIEGFVTQRFALVELFVEIGDLFFHLFGGKTLFFVDIVDEFVFLRHVVHRKTTRCCDQAIALSVELFKVSRKLIAQFFNIFFARFLVNRSDDGACEIEHLLELFRSDVEQIAQTRGRTLEIPDVRHWSSELDVTHALTTNLRARYFNAAALADDALETDALVLAARAFPVFGRAEDLLAEQAVLFGLERTVVDGFRLLDLATRPTAHILSACKRDSDRVEIINVVFSHLVLLSLTDQVACLLLCHFLAGTTEQFVDLLRDSTEQFFTFRRR